MIRIITLVIALSAMVLMVSCGGKKGPDAIPIETMETYTDNLTNFELKYPSNWAQPSISTGQRFIVLSSPTARARFSKYDPEGFPGAKLDVYIMEIDTAKTWEELAEGARMFSPDVYESEKVTIDGVQGIRYRYSFPLNDGMFKGEMYAAAKDSTRLTLITFESFAGTFDELYEAKFEEIIGSIKLATAPKPRTADTLYQEEEADPPSLELNERSGDGFTVGIPENFKSENLGKTPGAEKTYNYMGMRRGDSFIRVDIFDSKDQADLKKIVDENITAYRQNSGAKEVMFANKKAFMVDYNASNEVKGRVWFVLHKEKLFRVTINWYVPEQADFLPPFEKSAASFKLK